VIKFCSLLQEIEATLVANVITIIVEPKLSVTWCHSPFQACHDLCTVSERILNLVNFQVSREFVFGRMAVKNHEFDIVDAVFHKL